MYLLDCIFPWMIWLSSVNFLFSHSSFTLVWRLGLFQLKSSSKILISINQLQIFATVLAVAAAVPIEDTEEVKAAKAEFAAAFAAAEAGEHAALAPAAVATAYLADLPEVAEAKDAFRVVFDKYANGEVALPVAPVHEVAPVNIFLL